MKTINPNPLPWLSEEEYEMYRDTGVVPHDEALCCKALESLNACRELLAEIQWCIRDPQRTDYSYCPEGCFEYNGHAKNCRIAAQLQKVRGKYE